MRIICLNMEFRFRALCGAFVDTASKGEVWWLPKPELKMYSLVTARAASSTDVAKLGACQID